MLGKKYVSMLKTVALLYSFIFLWKLIILFQDYLISRKFKRTAFIQNRFFRFFLVSVNILTVTFNQFNTALLNKSINFLHFFY